MEARAEEARQALSGMIFAALKVRRRRLRAREGCLPLTIIGGFLGRGKTTLLNRCCSTACVAYVSTCEPSLKAGEDHIDRT